MVEVTTELPWRIAGRRVRVFAGHGDRRQPNTEDEEDRIFTWTTSDASGDASGDDRRRGAGANPRRELFSGYIEVAYGGGGAWLGMRVRLWTDTSSCRSFRSVQGVAWYEESHGRHLAPQVAIAGEEAEEAPATEPNAVVTRLERVVSGVVARFRDANVQALEELPSPRAKFEYELLQHLRELDVVVASSGGSSHHHHHVLFALPLFAGEDLDTLRGEGELESGAFLPGALSHPLVERGSRRTTISLRLATADDPKKSEGGANTWDVSLSWARDLRLSSQVTRMARAAGDGASSVDVIASYKQAFLFQWAKRRDFVGELRARAIVLEFDPVDFSRVFFMLQEQLDASAPLRVLVLSLAFTAEFFLTRSLSDLRVRLLDGRQSASDDADDGVAIALAQHAPDAIDAWDHDTPRLVAAFLSSLQSALTRHLYE